MKTFKISISPTGEVTVAVAGAPGASCLDATKFLEEALGGPVASREMTPEFYQEETIDASIKVEE